MSAYMISICRSVADRRRLMDYFASVPPSLAGVDAIPLAVYTPFEVLESAGPVEGVVLFEFASVEAARNWYMSAAYQEAKCLREGAGEFEFIVVESGWMHPSGRVPQKLN